MLPRSKLLTVPALVLCAAGAGVALTGQSAAQAPAGTTIVLQDVEAGARFAIDDNAPKSRGKGEPKLSLGDRLTFTNPVLRDGKPAGSVANHCVVTQPARISRHGSMCEAALILPEGTLYAHAITTKGGPDTVVGAVTGGTGEYAGARGTSTSQNGTITVSLLP